MLLKISEHLGIHFLQEQKAPDGTERQVLSGADISCGGNCSLIKAYYRFGEEHSERCRGSSWVYHKFQSSLPDFGFGAPGRQTTSFPKDSDIFCQGNVMNNNIDQFRMCISLE